MKILHLSDLHFGTVDNKLLKIMLEEITNIFPNLIVLSGDLTQRATESEFEKARDFVQSLHFNKVVVPGNHDISLYNLYERLFYPYYKYQNYIQKDLDPKFLVEGIHILGLNSSSRFRFKNGKISSQQFDLMNDFFKIDNQLNKPKILVVHHNLIHLKKFHHPIVNYKKVQEVLMSLKINIVLSGHLHTPVVEIFTDQLEEKSNHKVFLITAGTALSTRLRNVSNSFNLLEVTDRGFELTVYYFKKNHFIPTDSHYFEF